MQKILTVLCILTCLPVFSQTREGTLHYSIVSLYKGFDGSGYGLPDDSTFSSLSIDFNSKYTRRTETIDHQTNITVFNKATKDIYVALRNNEENFIRYYQSREVEEPQPEENPGKEQYKDNFYIDLLTRPPLDTVVIQTDETKIISGFVCKETILKLPDGDIILVWSTDSLPGLEEYGQISDRVKGTTVMSEMISKTYYSRIQLVNIDRTNKIDEQQLIPFPEGLILDLGNVLMDDQQLAEMNVMGYGLPYFIDHPDFTITLDKMKAMLDKSEAFQSFSDNPSVFDFVKLDVEVHKTGKISRIVFQTNSDVTESRTRSILDELKRKCTFKQVTINNKVVPFQFHIYYYFPH